MKGQVMKQDEYYDAVRQVMEAKPKLTILQAIEIVAKRMRLKPDTVQAGYYRARRARLTGQRAQAKTKQASRPSTTEILAKLEPVKTKPDTANGSLRDAALNALRAYEQEITEREAALAVRERQMDELRAKIATLA